MKGPLYAIYGAGGHGREVMPIAREQLEHQGVPREQLVFVDDDSRGKSINGHRVLTYEEFLGADADERFVAIAIADGRIRESLASRCKSDRVRPWLVRAGNSLVMDEVVLGEGAILSPFVTLTSNIRIGRHFHANVYSYVAHDCVIGDFVTFGPGVRCSGNVVIEDHVYLGTSAIVRQGKPGAPLVIGKGAVVGMGAVVTHSVPARAVVVGNPARPMPKNEIS